MTGQTPPGWYPDPYGTPGLQRWWDGGQWTQATQPSEEWDEPAAQQATPGFAAPTNPATPGFGAPTNPMGYASGAPGAPGYGQQPGWSPQPAQPPMWQQAVPAPAAPSKSNTGLLWGLAGGGLVVVILIVAVVLYATGVFGGSGNPKPIANSTQPTPGPTSSAASPPPVGSGTSPVTGTISDPQAGLSYDQLGGDWKNLNISAGFARLGFDKGEYASVQDNYDGKGNPYIANASSGTLISSVGYGGPGQLEAAAKGEFAGLEPASYSSHTKQDVTSRALTTANGKQAWLYEVKLSFPQAASMNWNWRTETAAVIVVDRGSARPGVVYISIPDSLQNQGDLPLLVNSVHAL